MSNFSSVVPIILTAFLLWLVGLTVVFYKLLSHYKRIASHKGGSDLVGLLDTVLNKEDKVLSEIKEVREEINQLDKHLTKPLQKVGLVRYNPFGEIGGDHSFSLTILNQNDEGFVLTGLHTRDRTRVYLKQVLQGVSKFELSKEEEKSLKQALNTKL